MNSIPVILMGVVFSLLAKPSKYPDADGCMQFELRIDLCIRVLYIT